MLTQLQTILLALLLVVLMAGMGASLTVEDFREVLRRPRGPLIGLLSQYGWMPLIAFGLCKALGLDHLVRDVTLRTVLPKLEEGAQKDEALGAPNICLNV